MEFRFTVDLPVSDLELESLSYERSYPNPEGAFRTVYGIMERNGIPYEFRDVSYRPPDREIDTMLYLGNKIIPKV